MGRLVGLDPDRGLPPVYVVTALLGLLLISAAALIVIVLTRGEKRARRVVRAVGGGIPESTPTAWTPRAMS